MGPRVHACLQSVQRSSKKCSNSAVLVRWMRRMVHADGGRGYTWLPPCLPIPILRGARRLAIQYQHNGRDMCDCSHWHLQPTVYLDNFSSHHISPIALSEFIFRYYLVSVPEVACLEIQGSGPRRRIEAWTQTWRRDGCNSRWKRRRHARAEM